MAHLSKLRILWSLSCILIGCIFIGCCVSNSWAETPESTTSLETHASDPPHLELDYAKSVQPILESLCFDCHAGGAAEGNLVLDDKPVEALIQDRALWWRVLKNVRADMMPPIEEQQPTAEQRAALLTWIKTNVFGVNPANPDPGRVTIRRLNRTEYRNTIRDLMGVDFDAEVVFPPDDTGFGFDNIGDALSLSPLLMEKYLQSATAIVKASVPLQAKVIPKLGLVGEDFQSSDSEVTGGRLSYKEPATVSKMVQVEHAGRYRLGVEVRLHGSFDFDPAQCQVTLTADGEQLYVDRHKWDERKSVHYEFSRDWQAGEHTLTFQLEPLPVEQAEAEQAEAGETYVNFHVLRVDVEGPMDRDIRVHPTNYERFFARDEPPVDNDQRRAYAREVLAAFGRKAFRRPVPDYLLSKLVQVAEVTYAQPSKTFEEGIAQAMTTVLASPRFLFRFEAPDAESQDEFPQVDEFALASRLSYFFWSTMPDDELLRLAEAGQLRERLEEQVDRLLQDKRSDALIRNFVGQWLRSRDVEHVSIDPLVALGYGEEYQQLLSVFRRRFRRQPSEAADAVNDEEWEQTRTRFRELRDVRDKFDGDTRRAMRQETEMLFEHIVREDRSLLELLDCSYTFLNEKLASLYGIPDVPGKEMRRVDLPQGHVRGGVLTQGTMLTVTSNPTRTSPVKRGLFILDNILGTPAPPAPGNVPELEEAQNRFGDREPSLRELLAVHRESDLCASCHSRMDPLGLALENFNALGMWRDHEHGLTIDTAGQLITGETFSSIQELKKILVTSRKMDYYRCVTQKLLTYALGRGLEDVDEFTVDQIVARVDQEDGRFRVLLNEVVCSAPFQRMRRTESVSQP